MPQSFADEFKSFPISQQLGDSLERAHRFAREQSHRLVTLEHLLLALTEDPDAIGLLETAQVDLGRLGADVSAYLGGLLEDMRAQGAANLVPDADLMRVLKAATTAAQQSRRRQIDGAIVLAAIVGDGKSAAAGLLKALGVTFEGAIRALQRANVQSRPKTPATAQSAWSLASTSPRSTPPLSADRPAQAAAAAGVEPTLASSAEEFLAAARARIQQRAAARAAESAASMAPTPPLTSPALDKPGPSAAGPAVHVSAAAAPPTREPTARSLVAAMQELAAEPAAAAPASERRPEPQHEPETESPETLPHPQPLPEPGLPLEASAPAATPGRGPQPLPHNVIRPPADARAAVPLAARPLRPQDGPLRPPLPSGPANLINRTPPGPAAPGRDGRAGWGNNGMGGPGLPSARPAGAPLQAPTADPNGATVVPLRTGAAAPRGPYPERGPLVESVPRRMQSGIPATAEVRIARDKIDGLMLALCHRGLRLEAYPTRALAVRLRAPNGGFAIEANAVETQWLDRSGSNLSDGFAAWRWTITPHGSGRNRLLLTVSARLIGQDGLVAEAAPSDRTIDVRIAPNYRRLAWRWTGWLAAVIGGALVAYFGGSLAAAVDLLWRQLSSG
jgi:hypothetical protein